MIMCEKCFYQVREDADRRDVFFCECCGKTENLVFFTAKVEDMEDPIFKQLMERGKLRNAVA